jgi:tRNA modification GTPase
VAVQTDTIVALSTPPGRSGIAVIRMSGSDSLKLLRTMVSDESYNPTPNLLSLKNLIDPNTGETLDEALVCYFKAPRSFTGEDVVELHCHGSPVLVRTIIDLVLKLGARLADPGEFSLRAVASGRLKLTEAEAIRDLIDAQTDTALRQATRQLKGDLSNRLRPAKEDLLETIVRLESSLEFVEEDLPAIQHQEIVDSLRRLEHELTRLRSTFGFGKLLRDGIRVAFVGRPNVGKSSLFNSLVGHGRAIVTSVPGTTRDTLAESLVVNGVPILLVDTAGLRSSNDEIESIGVERARRAAADADLLIVVIDGSELLPDEDQLVLDEVSDVRHIIALNKSDLPTFSTAAFRGQVVAHPNCSAVLTVSAKSEAGLESLRAAILQPFANGNAGSEGLLITNARHHDLLVRAIEAIASSAQLLEEHTSEEIVLIGLHNSLRYLGEITGETTTEEILGQIFSTFCIGK